METGTGFDFAAWQAEQSGKRAARRAALEVALRAGRSVAQIGRVWPACSPFIPECNTPEYLAEHIESREYGFGFATKIVVPCHTQHCRHYDLEHGQMCEVEARRLGLI